MIPLRDSIKSTTFPYVTVSLVAINTLIFIFQITLNERQLIILFNNLGVIPAIFTQFSIVQILLAGILPIGSLITSIFLHGSWLHLLGNMVYLWVFGDNVEDRLGHGGFFVFYLVAGVIGSLAHILANPMSSIPTIGASGSIAGILGAYLVFYPRAKVQALIPLIVIFTVTRIRAVYFLFIWFFIQVLNGITVMASGAQAVAWWAHIGGFLAGAIIAAYFKLGLPEGNPNLRPT
ncbi:MAG: rhomboid family intramembrane serine protease [Bacillota bacterium]|nr:rhomboid family intramembrane serine protease [Bacillota bacterium]